MDIYDHSQIIHGLLRPSHANAYHCFMFGLIFLGDRWEVLGSCGEAPRKTKSISSIISEATVHVLLTFSWSMRDRSWRRLEPFFNIFEIFVGPCGVMGGSEVIKHVMPLKNHLPKHTQSPSAHRQRDIRGSAAINFLDATRGKMPVAMSSKCSEGGMGWVGLGWCGQRGEGSNSRICLVEVSCGQRLGGEWLIMLMTNSFCASMLGGEWCIKWGRPNYLQDEPVADK